MNSKECSIDPKRILSSLVINNEKEAHEHLHVDDSFLSFVYLLCLLLNIKKKFYINTVEVVVETVGKKDILLRVQTFKIQDICSASIKSE